MDVYSFGSIWFGQFIVSVICIVNIFDPTHTQLMNRGPPTRTYFSQIYSYFMRIFGICFSDIPIIFSNRTEPTQAQQTTIDSIFNDSIESRDLCTLLHIIQYIQYHDFSQSNNHFCSLSGTIPILTLNHTNQATISIAFSVYGMRAPLLTSLPASIC